MLNPEKCVFGALRGMLLGYIISQRGIDANPEKVTALEPMGPIRDLKGVQKVLGCLAALSRFILRLDEKGFEYTGDDDTSRMPGGEVVDDDIVDRLTRILKDMPPYTACAVPEYSAARPPKEVSSHTP
jgi:hypothetical protein